jgi:hypothetical protein
MMKTQARVAGNAIEYKGSSPILPTRLDDPASSRLESRIHLKNKHFVAVDG